MEIFHGNGAECMVQFISDGCRGHITHMSNGQTVVRRGESTGPIFAISNVWLLDLCIYHPPEPVWNEVTQPEAYAACIADIRVQAQHKTEPDEWSDVSLYDGAWHWKDVYRFRMQED